MNLKPFLSVFPLIQMNTTRMFHCNFLSGEQALPNEKSFIDIRDFNPHSALNLVSLSQHPDISLPELCVSGYCNCDLRIVFRVYKQHE